MQAARVAAASATAASAVTVTARTVWSGARAAQTRLASRTGVFDTRARALHATGPSAGAAPNAGRQNEDRSEASTYSPQAIQLLDVARGAHLRPEEAIEAYRQLRDHPSTPLLELSDVKLERLCQAVVQVQDRQAAQLLIGDLQGAMGGEPGSWRRLHALQILIGQGMASDGSSHVLGRYGVDLAVKLAMEDAQAVRQVASSSLAEDMGSVSARSDVLCHLDAARTAALLHYISTPRKADHDPLPSSDLLILALKRLEALQGDAKLTPASIGIVARHLYFWPGRQALDTSACSYLIKLIHRTAKMNRSGLQLRHLEEAQGLARNWRPPELRDEDVAALRPYIELGALTFKDSLYRGKTSIAFPILRALYERLQQAMQDATVEGSSRTLGHPSVALSVALFEEGCNFILTHQPTTVTKDPVKVLQLVFEDFEHSLLPHVSSRQILSWTGRVHAIASAGAGTARKAQEATQPHAGRAEVAGLLEVTLRARQQAKLPLAHSQRAMAQAVLKSPIFPASVLFLARARRGDLVASLLELLLLVPPLPLHRSRAGPLTMLSDQSIATWTGLVDEVTISDRQAVLRAATEAKLRWHAAFLFHRWAEDQLVRDNERVFELVSGLIGGGSQALKWAEPDAISSRAGLPMSLVIQAAENGHAVKSNEVIDSTICVMNMVKLFATMDAAPPVQDTGNKPLNVAAHRDGISELDFARLIYRTFMTLNANRALLPDETTTLSAAAFALGDTSRALAFLNSKISDGGKPDIVDIGVMFAGIARQNIDMAVNTFLNKLNNVQDPNLPNDMADILARLQPTPQLYSMLISKSMFRSRNDLVTKLLADADQRGMMSSTMLRSLDVILRQQIGVRPKELVKLLRQLTAADEWTPDPRILAWFCRCAARGQSLKEAMTRARAHAKDAANSSAADGDLVAKDLDGKQVGTIEDLTAAVDILCMSVDKLGYVHGPTVLRLVDLLADSDVRRGHRKDVSALLDRVIQAVFHAKRIDRGAQRRSLKSTKWAQGSAREEDFGDDAGAAETPNGSTPREQTHFRAASSSDFATKFCDAVILLYGRLGDLLGASEVVHWWASKGHGPPPLSAKTRAALERWDQERVAILTAALNGTSRPTTKKPFWRPRQAVGPLGRSRVERGGGIRSHARRSHEHSTWSERPI